jgi:CheY-like chemotaxis protein
MTKRELILDDNAGNHQLRYFALMSGDYEIHQAEQGSGVVVLTQNTAFDMTPLDVELPDADGLERAEKLKARHPDGALNAVSEWQPRSTGKNPADWRQCLYDQTFQFI